MERTWRPSVRWRSRSRSSTSSQERGVLRRARLDALRHRPFALVVTFAPALILLAIEVGVELITRRDAVVLHYAFLAGLGDVFGVQALKRSGVDRSWVLSAQKRST